MPSPLCRPRRSFALFSVLACALIACPALADLQDTAPRIKPAVVAVGTYQATRNPAFRFLGTGFAVGEGRTVVTNAHVLPEVLNTQGMEKLVIAIPGEGQVNVREVARQAVDRPHDVAALRVAAGAPLPALRLGDSASVREGRPVAFTGFPIGGAIGLFPATHRGIVSAVTPISMPSLSAAQLDEKLVRRLAAGSFSVFQLDATAYPGNSGSPVFDPDTGDVLGIVNMVFVKGAKENAISSPSGITYAIPAAHIRALVGEGR